MRGMQELVQAGVEHPDVVRVAHDLVRFTPARRPREDLRLLLGTVQTWLRYTGDPAGPLDAVELIKAPWVSLQEIDRFGRFVGDCDDATVLLASLLGAVGYPTELRLVRADRRRPREFSHVYLAAWDGVGWVPLDPIVPHFGPGDEVPDHDVFGPRRRVPIEGSPRMSYQTTRSRGVGYAPTMSIMPYLSQQSTTPAAAPDESSFIDDAWGFAKGIFEKATPAIQEYLGKKLGRKQKKDQKAITTGGGTVPTPAAVPFFKKVDATGRLVTDWGKVAMVGGGAAAAGALVIGATRGRKRRR